MTGEEAAAFVAQLRAGKRFVTRFQEEEWGLTYAGDGRYHKWTHRPDHESEETLEETLTEPALLNLLTAHYRYDVMAANLRD
ncbi:MAG: hypothetical protein HC804_10950 [Anaerolineae bacterium]|nr:hypothetical protein [Anaerolineae bacterium]